MNENTTVKLPKNLLERVRKAMKAEQCSSYSDFARSALVEKCRRIEKELRETSPEEFEAIYGKSD